MKQGLYPNFYYLSLVLKNLEEDGILFTTYGTEVKVHFVIASPVGDNLALNMMLGFNMNFNLDFFCRFCICTKKETEILTSELAEKLRTNNGVLGMTLGIKRNCPFQHEINSFNILDCCAVDIVHDFLEGIIKLEMSHCIKHFVREGYFDLDFLNACMIEFNQLSRFESKNRSSKIKKEHLGKFTLKMSASEVALFIKYFSILVGEHIPKNDRYWNFFKIMYDLLDNVCKPSFTEKDLDYLSKLIKTHHEQCIALKLGTKANPEKLTPKHHIITHYVTLIRKLGPPKTFWVMRLEALHKKLKQYANVTASRKNILKSLTDKIQLNNSQMFYNNTKGMKISKGKPLGFETLKDLEIPNKIGNFPINYKLPTYFNASIENIRFEVNDIVLSFTKNEECSFVYDVFKVNKIFCIKNNIKLLVTKLEIVDYNDDLKMLEINDNCVKKYYIFELTNIVSLPTNLKSFSNKHFVNISNF